MSSKNKKPIPLTPEMSVAEALRVILLHDFEVMLKHRDAAYQGTDIEGVHQMRVAVRRMRSVLSLYRNSLDRDQAKAWRDEMRWLAGRLGHARDLDVFISEGLADTSGKLPVRGETKLRELALARREAVYRDDVRPMLDSARYQSFCQDFPVWVEQTLHQEQSPDAKRNRRLSASILDSARKLLDKQERRVLDAGSSIARDDAPAMHQLRIECKKLRYAAEFFRPLFRGMDKFIARMKGLQDILGVMNDLALTETLLESLTGEHRDDAELQRYAGALIGWRSYHFNRLLTEFDGHWESLVAARRPWWD